MGPAELGRVVANRYVESYIDQTGLAVALSVVDASKLDFLGEEIRRFVEQATSALPMFGDEFKDARLDTESYEGNAVYDLYDIFDKVLAELGGNPSPLRLDNALHSSQNAVISAVSYERNWDNPIASVRTTYAHGMSIWYPLIISDLTYHDLDFSKATGWNDYLLDFIDVSTGGVPDPEVDFQLGYMYNYSDEDNNGLIDTVQTTVQSPLNATLEVDVHGHSQSPTVDTHTMYLPMNTPRNLVVRVPEDAFVDLDIYLLNETGILMNNSLLRNILAKRYTISGQVRDKDGEPIIGATVTIQTMSGDEEIVESNASGFSGVISPLGLNATNITEVIKVTVRYNDWSASTDFLMFYPPEEKIVDFVLGPEGSAEFDDILLWALVALVVIEAILIVAFIIVLRGKGREPVEKSGEELLRELKLE